MEDFSERCERFMKTKTFFRQFLLIPSIISVAAFIVLCILGYFGFSFRADAAQEIIKAFTESVESKGILSDTGDIKVVALFLNNWKASAIAVILGFVPFLFLPAFVLLTNCVITGGVFAAMGGSGKALLLSIATGILPHGIFEIPALCISIAAGIQLCRFICCKIFDKGKLNGVRAGVFFKNTAKVFLLVVTPMLIAAAVIETYITPVLMGMI